MFKQKVQSYDRAKLQKKGLSVLKKKKYEFNGKLGCGYYGDVVSAMSKKDNKLYTAKIMQKDLTSPNELCLWPVLQHQNILPVLDIIHHGEVSIFIMPQLAGSLPYTLHHPMFQHNEGLFDFTIDWMCDMMNGIEFLHAFGVSHLNIKTDNILISKDFRAVMADFSAISETKNPVDRYVLPKYYRPPECWSSAEERPKVDGQSFDIWAAGMIFLYCFSNRGIGRQVWGRRNWMVDIYPLMFNCLQEPVFTELISKAHPGCKLSAVECSQSLNLLRGILRYNAKDRPSAKDILNHALLSKAPHSLNLFKEDIVWIENQRDIKRHFKEPLLQKVDVKNERTNLEYVKKINFQDKDFMKESEKMVPSKEDDDNKNKRVTIPNQKEIINFHSEKDTEMVNKILSNNTEKLSRFFSTQDVTSEISVLGNHLSECSYFLKNIDVQARNQIKKSQRVSEPWHVKVDKFPQKDYDNKVTLQDTCIIEKSENIPTKLLSQEEDIKTKENITTQDIINLTNNKDTETDHKMLINSYVNISALTSTHSDASNANAKRNHPTSQLPDVQRKTRSKKKTLNRISEWCRKKFDFISKMFSMKRN